MNLKAMIVVLAFAMTAPSFGSTAHMGVRTSVFAPQGIRILDVSYFYDELSPYGRWFQLEGYGWVWSPYGMSYGWRPYTNGYWVWTDWGWTWVSGWAWGWAPFHYGRWNHHSRHGWFWVPGTVWGPAWVVWRHRSGWIGWAPLSSQIEWRAGFGLDFGNVEIDRLIEPHCYSFVEERLFPTRNLHQHIQLAARNITLLRDATLVTGYSRSGDRIINRGIAVEEIERDTGQKIRRHRVVDTDAVRREQVKGDDVIMFRPKLDKKNPERTPRLTEPTPINIDTERRKLEKQQARAQSELEKEQRKEQQRIEEQKRIQLKQQRKEQQRIEEQKRIEQKQKRKNTRPPDARPKEQQPVLPAPKIKPPESSASKQLDNQQKAEKQALQEQRQREEQILRNRIETQNKVESAPTKVQKPAKPKPSKSNKP